MARRRLDAELTRRGLARSREQAQELIAAGAVTVRGSVATKPATQVETSEAIEVIVNADHGYVSRGAVKLSGALDAFARIDLADRDCLDAGASTGGFTQVLLERGGARVLAVDVGYGQLAWPLRNDERVTVMERTNIRSLAAADLPYQPDLIVADLSFISLRLVLPSLIACAATDADLVLMVKPQFEVGREAVGDGVIRDPSIRAGAVQSVADQALREGLDVLAVVASPLPGPQGNVEFFLWLRRGLGGNTVDGAAVASGLRDDALSSAIAQAIQEGPQ
ncbi:MAG: TlyA family RNA methyltransferase [Actinomycetota bacterium]|nr:TlyA family RNA methyltransferase [Actinomycetota bacterium]MDP2288465.1 TlyA family RNA methyltransferase [Actinomycetota bacterium]